MQQVFSSCMIFKALLLLGGHNIYSHYISNIPSTSLFVIGITFSWEVTKHSLTIKHSSMSLR